MKTKLFVIPILVMTLLTIIAAPPVQAELLTLSIILAVVFTSAVVTTEAIKSETGAETASTNVTNSVHQAGINDPKIELASQ